MLLFAPDGAKCGATSTASAGTVNRSPREGAPRRRLGKEDWVTDGIRTRDNRSHNPMLYLLSYGHREKRRRV